METPLIDNGTEQTDRVAFLADTCPSPGAAQLIT